MCPPPLPHTLAIFLSGLLERCRETYTHVPTQKYIFNLILSSLLVGYFIHKLLKPVPIFHLFCLDFYVAVIKDIKMYPAVLSIQ